MSSAIVRLVRYCNIFGTFDWLSETEARDKLARERELYARWSQPHYREALRGRSIREPFIVGKENA